MMRDLRWATLRPLLLAVIYGSIFGYLITQDLPYSWVAFPGTIVLLGAAIYIASRKTKPNT